MVRASFSVTTTRPKLPVATNDTPDGIEEIEFPGMMTLRDQFLNEIQDRP